MMFKFLCTLFLALAALQCATAQDAEKQAKEDLGYAYILPLSILTSKNATKSETRGVLPRMLLVDDRCVPEKLKKAGRNSEKPYTRFRFIMAEPVSQSY